MNNLNAIEILIEDLQKRIAFMEKRHDEILDRIGFIEELLKIDSVDLPDSELYPIHKETV